MAWGARGPWVRFFERRRAWDGHERRLLDILAGRVAELLRAYHRDRKLVFFSSRDALTGLYNRAFFEEQLRLKEKEARFPISLMLCDLDGLKVINDTLGHESGDRILRRAARVISASVRETDVVTRVGGDEFAVLLPQADRKTVEAVARRIEAAVASDNERHPGVTLSISVGTATAEGPGRPLDEVYRDADDSMYRNKLAGGAEPRGAVVRVLKAALVEMDHQAAVRTERVKRLALALGDAVGLEQERMARLGLLVDLYDIGRLGMPDGGCPRTGTCGENERAMWRRHAEGGYRIASASVELTPIAELIHRQHAWWNGRGYPAGPAGEDIDILNRILAIADAFDGLTHNRQPGATVLEPEAALAELAQSAGTRFDPHLLTTFTKIFKKGVRH